MDVTPKRVRCANCGIEIKWVAVEQKGQVFCWEGCAEGEPVPIRVSIDAEERDIFLR